MRLPDSETSETRLPVSLEEAAARAAALSQARLDRIAQPTSTYYHLFFRWFVKLTDDPETFTPEKIKARLQDVVGPRVARLKRLVGGPPPETTAAQWLAWEEELQQNLALGDAIYRVLELRAGRKRTGPRTWATRKAVSPESAPVSPCTPNQDPFHGE